MSRFGVNPQKELELEKRFEQLRIHEDALVEKFIRSSGKGGQNVNKLATCVYLKHLPTGIEVKCQKERAQAINRFIARRMLADRIESMMLGKQSAEQQEIERIRRQKRKRSKRAKEKMLVQKKRCGEKKQLRAKVCAPAE